MPPKPKFTKEEIVSVALSIVSERGIDALTARELGAKLGSSARPIFTVFNGMEELQNEVRSAAMRLFEKMQPEGTGDMPIFKQFGMKMILFGMKEPKLYQLIFMRETDRPMTFDDFFERLGATAVTAIQVIERDYGLNEKQAKRLFEDVWIYTFGIGTLCATGVCSFSAEELGQSLTTEFEAMLHFIREEKKE